LVALHSIDERAGVGVGIVEGAGNLLPVDFAGGGDGGAKALRAPPPLVVSVAGDAEDGAAHGEVVAFAEELEEAALAEGEDHRWLAIGRRFRRRTGVRG
jgi:hypothetical protein